MQNSSILQESVQTLSSRECQLEEYLKSIKATVREKEPKIKALVPESDRWKRLRDGADKLSEKYTIPEERPPLYGVPIGIKDNFNADGFKTKAGSELPSEELNNQEANIVKILKNNGALILSKTVTTEFAYSTPGPTRNPCNLEHTPGGSSSGSAAAVAAGYCPLAIGSQTGGSVIRPAAFCGITGFKPTFGRISRDGMIPFAPTVDHVGLFTQTPQCMRFAASIICPDWRIRPKPNHKPVLGVPGKEYLTQASIQGLTKFENQVSLLQSSGYDIKRVQAFSDVKKSNFLHKQLLAAEKALVHKNWFKKYKQSYSSPTREFLERGRKIQVGELADNQSRAGEFREKIIGIMRDTNIDLWVTPAAKGPAPKGIDDTGSPVMNQLWTRSHLPVVTIPIDQSKDGLPLGLQIISLFGNDEKLIDWSIDIYRTFCNNIDINN